MCELFVLKKWRSQKNRASKRESGYLLTNGDINLEYFYSLTREPDDPDAVIWSCKT